MAKHQIIHEEKTELCLKFNRAPEYLDYQAKISVKGEGKKPITMELEFIGIEPLAAPIPPKNHKISCESISSLLPKVYRWARKYGYAVLDRTKIMDTDDLNEEAYEILLRARQLNDILWAELGASSRNYENEEDYLNGMLKFIKDVKEKPEWYQDMWLMDEKIDQASLLHIEKHIKKVQNIPFQKRKFQKY